MNKPTPAAPDDAVAASEAPLVVRQGRGALRDLAVAAAALLVLPFALDALGLTLKSAADVAIMAVAVMGLNILVGHTGLVSFGPGAWFGVGAYAAAIAVSGAAAVGLFMAGAPYSNFAIRSPNSPRGRSRRTSSIRR